MKTAISIPDPVFRSAEHLAARLGVTRSQLYTKALSGLVEKYRDDLVTSISNEIYGPQRTVRSGQQNRSIAAPHPCQWKALVRRGEIWWASLPDPVGSGPGFRRPLLIVPANSFNASRINTVTAAVITSNLKLADAPGNVRLPTRGTGLTTPSVVNVSQLITVDKSSSLKKIGRLMPRLPNTVDEGLQVSVFL